MGVQDRPQCFFEIEINREPGKAALGAFQSRFSPAGWARAASSEFGH